MAIMRCMTQTLLPIHIAAGGLAIVFGTVALIAKKGGKIHRRIGLLFVYTILVMAFSAAILAFLKSPGDANVRAALMTAYFVVTALTTVRPVSRWSGPMNVAALTVALALALFAIVSGVQIFNLPGHVYKGIPFFIPLVMATVLLLGASGDVRIMRSGPPRGGARLARHLWRMCFALFIAAGSFFSIRSRVAKVLPEPFTTGPMRALPIILLFVAMFYWLWRVRSRRVLGPNGTRITAS